MQPWHSSATSLLCAVAVAVAVVLTFGCSCHAADPAPFRLPGSPYPAPSTGPNCSTSLIAFSDSLQRSQLMLMSSAQGLAARTCPLLFRVGDASPADMQTAFASDFPAFHSALNTSIATDFTQLLIALRQLRIAAAYVLCDLNAPDSCAAATSLCAVSASASGYIVVHAGDEEQVKQLLQIPCAFDARNSSVGDVLEQHPLQGGAGWSCSVAVLQDTAKLPYLVDFAVYARAVMCQWRALPRASAAHTLAGHVVGQ